jgi:pyrimidine operon attenuation protein/uracil phosphoribosyltransferase
MEQKKTILLNQEQIEQKLNRITYQIFEDNLDEKEIILAGIYKSGFTLAQQLTSNLKAISTLNITLIEVHINKHSHVQEAIKINLPTSDLAGKVVVLVDDVMNSGKTMLYALKPFLQADLKKLRTAVLVDRDHKTHPIAADFIGIRLATTIHNHVTAIIDEASQMVYLS